MDANYYREMAADQAKHWWYEGRRQIIAAMIAKTGLPKGMSILEAGCGPGANLNMLKNFGQVKAFEPDEFAGEHAAKISALDIYQGGLPEPFPFPADRFDLIGAFDVIEHIEEDVAALSKLHAHLNDNGKAIFTVPAHQWLWSHHDEINDHKRRYSKASFKKALEDAGFTVEKISYYNMWLFPMAVAVRALKKCQGVKDESDVSMPSPPVNKALRFIFGTERFLLPYLNLPFGLSLIAVCKK